MSITVESLASRLEGKGYKLKEKVKIGVWKTETDGVDYWLVFEERELKRKEKESIDNFGKLNILGSVTFTTDDKAKFKYTKELGERTWVLREVGIGPIMINIDGLKNVQEIYI
jgi:hypothetical protein